jgi:uncharacterized SAM-binding protein YcdF (DUF218 family)
MQTILRAVSILLQPGHLLVLGLVAGWILTILPMTRRAGMCLSGTVVLSFVLITCLPLGDWLLRPLENRFPRPPALDRVDGIVVLGGGQEALVSRDRDRIALNDAGERLIEAGTLARRFPDAQLVFTGGNGPPGLTEADVSRRVFAAMGLDADAVIYESRSSNTWDNAVMLRDLVAPARGEVWLLVTSASHMPRAMGAFRAAGWQLEAYPVDYHTTRRWGVFPMQDFEASLRGLDVALHEYFGLVGYRLLGRTQELFPAP